MDRMPGALPVGEIPFGEEGHVPAIHAVGVCCEGIPPNLDVLEPGPVLAGFLASIDVSEVSGLDQIVMLRAHRRMVSHYQGHVYRDMSAVTQTITDTSGDDAVDAATAAEAEIGVALHLSRRATENELAFALSLAKRLPRLSDMLRTGVVDVGRAKAIERYTLHLTDIAAQAVLDEIADDAPSWTVGQLRARIQKLAIQVDPHEAVKRCEQATADRRIVTESNDTGTVTLSGMDLAPDAVAVVTDRINTIAKNLRGDGEARTMDQLRADIYLDLLTGTNHTTARRGVVDIRVDLTTLIGLDDNPAELSGYGPIIADVARRVVDNADDAEWRVTVTDPVTGRPTHTGTTSRRPTAAQRRRVEIRDTTCIFPGCRMPAIRSDIDHTVAVEDGGETTDDNLAPLCRYHHSIKHRHHWTYQRNSHGDYVWTTQLGQIVTTARPPP